MTTQSAQSLYELVGAPLMALVDAESQAAKATANFIKEMGFKEVKTAPKPAAAAGELEREVDFGDLRMVKFHTQKSLPGSKQHETFKVEVPLLSLLPIPALQIKDAELEFFARIVEIPTISQPPIEPSPEGQKEPEDQSTLTEEEKDREYSMLRMPGRDIKATFGTTAAADPASGRQKLDMQIKIKIKMEQADIPAGLGSLFNLMQQNISSTKVEKTDDRKKAPVK